MLGRNLHFLTHWCISGEYLQHSLFNCNRSSRPPQKIMASSMAFESLRPPPPPSAWRLPKRPANRCWGNAGRLAQTLPLINSKGDSVLSAKPPMVNKAVLDEAGKKVGNGRKAKNKLFGEFPLLCIYFDTNACCFHKWRILGLESFHILVTSLIHILRCKDFWAQEYKICSYIKYEIIMLRRDVATSVLEKVKCNVVLVIQNHIWIFNAWILNAYLASWWLAKHF